VEQRHYAARVVPEPAADGKVGHVLAVTRDITDLWEAQEALRRADRQKDDFLGTLAHELRNPLAPLRTGLHVLQRGSSTPEERRLFKIMERQLDHMMHLVDELLDIARISQGKIVLKRETLPLQSVLEHAVDACRPLLDAQGHTLVWKGVDRQWHVHGDLTRLVQVVGNLLNNAAKYTPAGGHVGLRAVEDGEGLAVIVEDDGIGIPTDVLGRLFDRFVQVDQHLERAQGGLGIGLSVVKSLVEMHGGRVSVESAGPGTGSRFVVWLPRAHAPQSEPATSSPLQASMSVPRTKVLIVDDYVDAAETLAMAVELGGHEVHLAHDGASALRIAAEKQPAVVFLDIGMPGMSGYETATKLRALPGGESRTLVAVTGLGSEEDRARSLAAGFDVHLTKPVDLSEVQRILSQDAMLPTGATSWNGTTRGISRPASTAP
jgi:CheY-like chemotaxis protein